MDGLARTFAKEPIVFLEHLLDSPHSTHRLDRFMAAWEIEYPDEPEWLTPLTMADSGHLISFGMRDFQKDYRHMAESELARPAKGEL